MTTLLTLAWAVPLLLYALWVTFLATMNVTFSEEDGFKVKPYVRWATYPLLAVLGFLDVLANATIFTLVLMELPREWTVSTRLRRHMFDAQGSWGRRVALAVENWLDPFDHTGDHI